ncbi:ATP-dependent nuclease [Sporosarcina limicola]|uniref:ATP-dependent endonuclease of OLD family n=1 Tax=Sporosarcina limicola TaxID=34101 RepID=A0A927RGV7_9BACL|nr:ATP-dependent endonuclease [Sporosarcina limicola]MBE1556862.1 putative ATP-dependent endonuclease of OLD family [Sporosarcina limicola]
MRISEIKVENFRLLKNSSIQLEEDLSLILGKNNCGKTSLLLILDKFLNGSPFSFDDFNSSFRDELKSYFESDSYPNSIGEPFPFIGISLKLFIKYDDNDDLSNIGDKVIMDLDPENKVIVLGFEYKLLESEFANLKDDYNAMNSQRELESNQTGDILSFIKQNFRNYFTTSKKSILYDTETGKENDSVYTDLLKEKINIGNIVNFKWINARRNVSNKDTERSLSTQSAKIYKKMEDEDVNRTVIDKFKNALTETDKKLEDIYGEMFNEIIEDVRKFGGTTQDQSSIRITSTLQHKELLEDNTTVVYGSSNSGIELPESYNGLGYMNLISMIFEIKIILNEFQNSKDSYPADINLLFIEEPEVHTHPQMQKIFIKNIKSLLGEGIPVRSGQNRKLQTIISTHSAHIVAESDFEDIKYFRKEDNEVKSKSLKDLEKIYCENKNNYKFLKQYLTLHRSDLFFADKVIFIEGDTERILLPAMMKKIDIEDELNEFLKDENTSLPLLSQNISIIEVGAYSHVFEEFIDFIGVKSLIITDIDSFETVFDKDKEGNKKLKSDGTEKTKELACRVSDGDGSSNYSLKYFLGKDIELESLAKLTLIERTLIKNSDENEWKVNEEGHVLLQYQSEEKNKEDQLYHARSFEDSFFHINKEFIKKHTFNEEEEFTGSLYFPSLTQKKMKDFATDKIDSYEMANGVGKKPAFAMEILLNSKMNEINMCCIKTRQERTLRQEYSNWEIPKYIKEGLQWLKED